MPIEEEIKLLRPRHHELSDKIIRIGENPPGVKFDFNSILQV